jgi:pyruvate,orthophosphate dikinase
MACKSGRTTRKNLKLGICGEHGGDTVSISFFEWLGLDYVSCSPLRVPIARLAAAKAVIAGPGAAPRILKSNSKPRTVVRPPGPRARTTGAKKTTAKKAAKRGKAGPTSA